MSLPGLYLSFATDEGWLGCVLTDADSTDMLAAVVECHARGCNPGGSVLGYPVEALSMCFSDDERAWFESQPRWTLITTPPPGARKVGDLEDEVQA